MKCELCPNEAFHAVKTTTTNSDGRESPTEIFLCAKHVNELVLAVLDMVKDGTAEVKISRGKLP